MIRKILIANRGEIACRIVRTCRDMGITSVAVYSDADASALHVRVADEAVHIGGSLAAESYLNAAAIITAVRRTGADAIHPGYGFLAENADFAQAVMDAGIIFIGPSPDAIAAMGNKRAAKRLLKDVPLVPGYDGDDQSDSAFIAAADDTGFPIMIKASAGGGGKGMRRVDNADDFPDALAGARREAKQAFGDDTLILEKYIEQPRHIEVQICGDVHGTVIALGERECSIQRRHQKIIEESPSSAIDDDTRRRMSEAAIRIGQQLNYTGAGTVEFLVDTEQNFYFMEMNTRLQVEHPVTELVYHLDLVRWQIMIAEGHGLGDIAANLPASNGHAVEARIYAEVPESGFLPATGRILNWEEPDLSGIRIDSGIKTGDDVTTFYDPLLAKVIAHGETRAEAIRRLDYALSCIRLLGLGHNMAFLRRILRYEAFTSGDISTHFIDDNPALLRGDTVRNEAAVITAALAHHLTTATGTSWRNNSNGSIKTVFALNGESIEIGLSHRKNRSEYSVEIADTAHSVTVHAFEDGHLEFTIDGHRRKAFTVCDGDVWWVHLNGEVYRLDWQTPLPLPGERAAAAGSLRAPMPGQIISVTVGVGQTVKKGDNLLTLEAMKMEHRIVAPYDGVVRAIHFQAGDTTQTDAVLLEIESDGD